MRFNPESMDLKQVRAFLQAYHSALGPDSKESKEADDGNGGKGKKWLKPWTKDGAKDGAEKPGHQEAAKDAKAENKGQQGAPKSDTETAVCVHAAGVVAKGPVYRPVTWVGIRADRRRSRWVTLRCLVDEGCEVSFISSEAAQKLGFAPEQSQVDLTLSYFGGWTQRSGGIPCAVKLQDLDG